MEQYRLTEDEVNNLTAKWAKNESDRRPSIQVILDAQIAKVLAELAGQSKELTEQEIIDELAGEKYDYPTYRIMPRLIRIAHAQALRCGARKEQERSLLKELKTFVANRGAGANYAMESNAYGVVLEKIEVLEQGCCGARKFGDIEARSYEEL
jgi:hypothetical protein